MSLYINAEQVTSVLLNDGWHEVKSGSFYLDSYEFAEDHTAGGLLLHGGGNSGVCATGFSFDTAASNFRIAGPLTAIHAVKEYIGDR